MSQKCKYFTVVRIPIKASRDIEEIFGGEDEGADPLAGLAEVGDEGRLVVEAEAGEGHGEDHLAVAELRGRLRQQRRLERGAVGTKNLQCAVIGVTPSSEGLV